MYGNTSYYGNNYCVTDVFPYYEYVLYFYFWLVKETFNKSIKICGLCVREIKFSFVEIRAFGFHKLHFYQILAYCARPPINNAFRKVVDVLTFTKWFFSQLLISARDYVSWNITEKITRLRVISGHAKKKFAVFHCALECFWDNEKNYFSIVLLDSNESKEFIIFKVVRIST